MVGMQHAMHHAHATSFLGVEGVVAAGSNVLGKLFAPEVAAYHWMANKLGLASAEGAEGAAAAAEGAAGAGMEDLHKLPMGQWRMVDYYAESCPHCVNLTPKWDKASQLWLEKFTNATKAELKAAGMADDKYEEFLKANEGERPVVEFKKVQCMADSWKPGKDRAVCQKEGIQAYPTLRLYGPKGAEYEYQGPRSTEHILMFLKKKLNIPLGTEEKILIKNEEEEMLNYATQELKKQFNLSDSESAAMKKAARAANSAFDDGKSEDEAKKVVSASLKESVGDEGPGSTAEKLEKIFFSPGDLAGGEEGAEGTNGIGEDAGAAGDNMAAKMGKHVAPEQNTVVEYYAAACPHCVNLKPTWDEAVKTDAGNIGVKWVQKECLDAKWKPGKDFDECMKNDVPSFPSIRFESHKLDGTAPTGIVHEFKGQRKAADFLKWAKAEQDGIADIEKASAEVVKAEGAVAAEEPAAAAVAAEEPAAAAEGAEPTLAAAAEPTPEAAAAPAAETAEAAAAPAAETAEAAAAPAAEAAAEVKVASLGGLNLLAAIAATSVWSGVSFECEKEEKKECFF